VRQAGTTPSSAVSWIHRPVTSGATVYSADETQLTCAPLLLHRESLLSRKAQDDELGCDLVVRQVCVHDGMEGGQVQRKRLFRTTRTIMRLGA
jgi:hypothetical protein